MPILLSSSYILMFDMNYTFQPRLKSLCKVIDLTNIVPTKYMCSIKTLKNIQNKMKNIKNSLCFIGSGDYHHLTLSILQNLSNNTSLIVIDKHIDFANFFDGYVSCGSWLKETCKLENIKEIFVISEEMPKDILNTKIEAYTPAEYMKISPKYDLYISIDKDILNPSAIHTTWDQGHCSLNTLFNILFYLGLNYNIIGVDICGEPPTDFFSSEHFKSENINLKLHKFFFENTALLAG